MLNSPMRGKWAQGIVPRNFTWVIKDKLAVSERPGGHGLNHRPVRRMEEIIWLKQEEFTRVVSLLPSPHNLHAYSEHQVAAAHVPFGPHADPHQVFGELYPKLREWIAGGDKLLIHLEEVGDRVMGVLGGYLLWSGMLPNVMQAINVIEHLLGRQMGSPGRELVAAATRVEGSAVPPIPETRHELGPLPPQERKVRKPLAKKAAAARKKALAAKSAALMKARKDAAAKSAARAAEARKNAPSKPPPLPKKLSATAKKAAAKKAAAEKAGAEKIEAEKKAAKKSGAKKSGAKKSGAKKSGATKEPVAKKTAATKEPVAKKAPAKKASGAEAIAAKAPAKRTAIVKKAAPAKKAPAKATGESAAKTGASKKPAAKKAK
jgi:hypothetical protein